MFKDHVMNSYNKDFNIEDLLLAFKEIDTRRNDFNELFCEKMVQVLNYFYPYFTIDSQSDEVLNTYATQMQNLTESIVYKDTTYPHYRLKEELLNVTRVASHDFDAKEFDALYELLLKTAKALMVDSNKDVYNLSASGFHLLEANAKIYSQNFISALSTLDQLSSE